MENLTGAKVCKKIASLSLLVALGTLNISNKEALAKEISNSKIEKNINTNKGDELNMEGYIYIPLSGHSAPQPVGYTTQEANNENIYTKNDKEYQLDRIVTFYTDTKDIKQVRNSFAGHLVYGEILEYMNQKEGKIVFGIYKQLPKKTK